MKRKGTVSKARKQLIRFVILFTLLGMLANMAYRQAYHVTAEKTVMRTDSEGYYQYLPHFFIMDWDRMDKMHWAKQYGEGKTLNIYTCGVAYMQLPFFLAAHGLSYFFEQDTSGYAPFYFLSVFFASLFYVLLGLIFIYKFLLRFFTHQTALWTIVLLFFATNLFYYTTIAPGMSHAYSFSLFGMFIYFVPVFYEKPSLKNLFCLAIPLAVATLIRPTNLLLSLFLFLYDVFGWKDLKSRFGFWFRRWYYLLVMLAIGILAWVPQMVYWHAVTGKYIFYSYQDEGTFPYLLSPKIFTVLIGPRNGWLIYTPLMILAVGSLLVLSVKKKLSSWAITLIMVMIIYINSSWWRPTFSGAAGYRALIEYLPFMAVPFAWFFEKAYAKKKALKIGLTSVFVIFIIYNILFSYKYSSWLWWNTDWQWSYFLRLVKF